MQVSAHFQHTEVAPNSRAAGQHGVFQACRHHAFAQRTTVRIEQPFRYIGSAGGTARRPYVGAERGTISFSLQSPAESGPLEIVVSAHMLVR